MELEQIKAIIGMMKDNDLSEFSMEQDGLKIRIKRGPEGFQQTVTLPPAAPPPRRGAGGRARTHPGSCVARIGFRRDGCQAHCIPHGGYFLPGPGT